MVFVFTVFIDKNNGFCFTVVSFIKTIVFVFTDTRI